MYITRIVCFVLHPDKDICCLDMQFTPQDAVSQTGLNLLNQLSNCFIVQHLEREDVLTHFVGRKVKVPSSWFGLEYGKENPDEEYLLTIDQIRPETRAHHQRLVLICDEGVEYEQDVKDFSRSVKPYLIDDASENEQGRMRCAIPKACTFSSITTYVSLNEDDHTYAFTGRFVL